MRQVGMLLVLTGGLDVAKGLLGLWMRPEGYTAPQQLLIGLGTLASAGLLLGVVAWWNQ
jgi:hypothetical protein